MQVQAINPETGEKFQAESAAINMDFIKSMQGLNIPNATVKRMIEDLEISADAKTWLFKFSNATIAIGEYVIKIGRKILDVIFKVYNEFPSASFGLVFGSIAGFLISSIPIIGVVLGPIFTPIAMAFGLVGGLLEDLKDKALKRKIAEVNASFSPLNHG